MFVRLCLFVCLFLFVCVCLFVCFSPNFSKNAKMDLKWKNTRLDYPLAKFERSGGGVLRGEVGGGVVRGEVGDLSNLAGG